MNFLNGIPPTQTQKPVFYAGFWHQMPEMINGDKIATIEDRIASMQRNYKLYQERNEILSVISQMNKILNRVNNEINGIQI
jgi:hypothetical protein